MWTRPDAILVQLHHTHTGAQVPYVTEISVACVVLAGKVQCAEMEWETFKAALLQQALWNTDSHKWKHLCGSLMNVGALKANKNGPNVNVNHLKIKLFPHSF